MATDRLDRVVCNKFVYNTTVAISLVAIIFLWVPKLSPVGQSDATRACRLCRWPWLCGAVWRSNQVSGTAANLITHIYSCLQATAIGLAWITPRISRTITSNWISQGLITASQIFVRRGLSHTLYLILDTATDFRHKLHYPWIILLQSGRVGSGVLAI